MIDRIKYDHVFGFSHDLCGLIPLTFCVLIILVHFIRLVM